MKKHVGQLRLNRETLRALNSGPLALVAGGTSEVPTLCDPSNNSQCDTACLACPLRPPTIEN
jgi:hypothetical protein